MNDRYVYESIAEVNARHGGQTRKMNTPCGHCGRDKWRLRWGVNPAYKSAYNPGEYVGYTCVSCGHYYEVQS